MPFDKQAYKAKNSSKLQPKTHNIMTLQVSFYILSYPEWQDCFEFCYKLLKKVHNQAMPMAISCTDTALCSQFEQFIQQRQRCDFLPIRQTGAILTLQNLTQPPPSLVMNLATADAPINLQWQHCLQIVPNNPPLLAKAREQFKYYQQRGDTLKTHKIG